MLHQKNKTSYRIIVLREIIAYQMKKITLNNKQYEGNLEKKAKIKSCNEK